MKQLLTTILLLLFVAIGCKQKRHDYIEVIVGTDTALIYGGDNSIDMSKVKSSSGRGQGDTVWLTINDSVQYIHWQDVGKETGYTLRWDSIQHKYVK
jgi:hypothetical protein